MNVGTEWLVDAEHCSARALRDLERVRGLCDEIVRDLALQAVGESRWHQFPHPGGVTGLYLLTESHLACHTYPETGIATFNLYCCTPRSEWAWERRLKLVLGAARVRIRVVDRGTATDEDHASFETNFPELTTAREVSGR